MDIVHDNQISIPFDSLAKLTNLKAIAIERMENINNTMLPDTLCDLKEMHYFEMSYTYALEYVPFDCISTQWINLYYFEMYLFPLLTDIDPKFWQLPKLDAVVLELCNFGTDSFSFDTFEGISSNLRYVSLGNNPNLCNNGSIVINGTKCNGFNYLARKHYNYTLQDMQQIPLLEFIAKFDVCYAPCGDETLVCLYVVCTFDLVLPML